MYRFSLLIFVSILFFNLTGCGSPCPGCGGRGSPKSTPLTLAVIDGDVKRVRSLLKGSWLSEPVDPNDRVWIPTPTSFRTGDGKKYQGSFNAFSIAVLRKDFAVIDALMATVDIKRPTGLKSKYAELHIYGYTTIFPSYETLGLKRNKYLSSALDQAILMNEAELVEYIFKRNPYKARFEEFMELAVINRNYLCQPMMTDDSCITSNNRIIDALYRWRGPFSDRQLKDCRELVSGLLGKIDANDVDLQNRLQNGCEINSK